MATTDTKLSKIIFNKLSQAKYDELKAAGQLNDNEFYITPDIDESIYVTTNTQQSITAKKSFEAGLSTNTITPINNETPVALMADADNGLQLSTDSQGAVNAKLIGDKINDISVESNDGTLVTTKFLNTKLQEFFPTTITYWN